MKGIKNEEHPKASFAKQPETMRSSQSFQKPRCDARCGQKLNVEKDKQESRGKSTQPEANAPSLLKCVKQTPSSQKWLREPMMVVSQTTAKCLTPAVTSFAREKHRSRLLREPFARNYCPQAPPQRQEVRTAPLIPKL